MAESNAQSVEVCFHCNFCLKTFTEKNDFMIHKKTEHRDKVTKCWNFSTGTCIYGEKHAGSHMQGNLKFQKLSASFVKKTSLAEENYNNTERTIIRTQFCFVIML